MAETIGQPDVNVIFARLADTAMSRSERGVVALILRDDTSGAAGRHDYGSESEAEADAGLWTAASLQAIKDALHFGANTVHAFGIGTKAAIATALQQVAELETSGWVTVASGSSAEDCTAIVSWVKAQAAKQSGWRCVVTGNETADHMQVVNLATQSITFADGRGKSTTAAYLPSMAGLMAACNVTRDSTYYICDNLTTVEELADVNAEINKGNLVLTKRYGSVRIARGVNTLKTITDAATEDMRLIEVVEATCMIRDDIRRTFLTEYAGQVRNTADNQANFLAGINSYLEGLVAAEIISEGYTAELDMAAQKAAWKAAGTDVSQWDEDAVRRHPYKDRVYLTLSVGLLMSMNRAEIRVTLN